MTATQTTRTVTLADVKPGDILFQFGTVLMKQPLIVSRVDHFGKVTSIRYTHGGFVPAAPGTTKVVLSVHTAEPVDGPVVVGYCEECFYLVADCKCA